MIISESNQSVIQIHQFRYIWKVNILVEAMRSCPKIKLGEPEKTGVGILDEMLFFEIIKSPF